METKEQFVKRRGVADFDIAIRALAEIVKRNDGLPRNNFMNREDTEDVIKYFDDVLSYSVHHPHADMYALTKLSADHHGIAFDIPEQYMATYRQFKRDVNYKPAQQVAGNIWSAIPVPAKLAGVAVLAFLFGRCSKDANAEEVFAPTAPSQEISVPNIHTQQLDLSEI